MAAELDGDTRSIEEARLEAVRQAQSIAPGLRARAERADLERHVSAESIQEIRESGLFGVIKPRVFGGSELGIASLVTITAELAAACGSTGWVYGVLAGHSWLMNLFPSEAKQEVFDDPQALTATVFRLSGEVTRVDGGYRLVNGAGRFCSGIDYASWVIVGNAVVADDTPPEPRFFVLPRRDLEVVDDWHTVGMRGTGSRSIRVAETFIPAHRSVSLEDMSKGSTPGAQFHSAPLYRMPFQLIAPFSLIGAPLGIARGALEIFSGGLKRWLEGSEDAALSAESATLARMAHSAAEIDAARSLVQKDAEGIDAAAGANDFDALYRARISRNWAFAAQTSRHATARIFEAAGGSAVYATSDIQRMWRDANAAAQHYAFIWDNAMADYGRVLMGLAPLHTVPKRR